MNKDIQEMRAAGYTDEEIAKMIAEGDAEIAKGIVEELIEDDTREEFEDEAQRRGILDFD